MSIERLRHQKTVNVQVEVEGGSAREVVAHVCNIPCCWSDVNKKVECRSEEDS
jgi:hypothetical protein